jgi:hypothetical protein
MNCQRDLPEVVSTGIASHRFAGGLHRRQKQRDQDADNRDHDEQFDDRKTTQEMTAARLP